MKPRQTKNDVILVSLAAGFTLVTTIASLAMNNLSTMQLLGTTQTLLLVAFAVWHAIMRYGFKGLAVFFLASQIVSHALENLSISTGFPFGNYHYSQGLAFLFQVPIVIGIAYFAYGYLAWMVANVLLGKLDERLKQWATVILPLTAAFVMVMWDVVMDPINSTVRHYWIWEEGGGYNGVPLTNYLGWFLTVYLFYQIFALYVRAYAPSVKQASAVFWATPVVVYLVTGLSFVLMYFVVDAAVVTDAAGHVWDKRGIYETAAVVSLFTMVFTSFLAIVKLKKL